jgi:diguanylate cyclase (GGDEF)-like protein
MLDVMVMKRMTRDGEAGHIYDDDISRLPVELGRLHHIAAEINSGRELPDVLGIVAHVAAEESASDKSAIFLMNDDGVTMRLGSHEGLTEELAEAWAQIRVGYGAGGLAAMKGRVVIVDDIEHDPLTVKDRPLYRQADIRSEWAVPMIGRDEQVIGAFAMYYPICKRPERRQIFMAQLYSFHAAMAIEHARLTEQLVIQAIRDGKTGLFNHDHFRERFALELERADRQTHHLSLLMADIDNYKNYNDTYGHLMGDRALTIIGATFRRIARATDIAARYGGEEFAVLLPDTDEEGAIIIAERIRQEVEEELFPGHDGQFDVKLTLSVGVASHPHDGGDIDSLIEMADHGLYAAKESGRNKVMRGVE